MIYFILLLGGTLYFLYIFQLKKKKKKKKKMEITEKQITVVIVLKVFTCYIESHELKFILLLL